MAITEFDLTTYVLMQNDTPLAAYTDGTMATNAEIYAAEQAAKKTKRDKQFRRIWLMGVPMNPLKRPEVL